MTDEKKFKTVLQNKGRKTMKQLSDETGLSVNKVFRIIHGRLVYFDGKWYTPTAAPKNAVLIKS